MKKSVSLIIVTAMLAFYSIPVSAGTTSSTPVSGTYEGKMETKSFYENNTSGKASSSFNSNIELLFNGNVFIYQDGNAKCMGNYSIDNNTISFEVTSTKGNAQDLQTILNNTFKFSKSGNKLMLIGTDQGSGDVYIYSLSKTKS